MRCCVSSPTAFRQKWGRQIFILNHPGAGKRSPKLKPNPENTVGAENYYQHAEHYFRSMSSA